MNLFKHILIPTDGSEYTRAAISKGLERLIASVKKNQQTMQDQLNAVDKVCTDLQELQKIEESMLRAANNCDLRAAAAEAAAYSDSSDR